MSIGDFFFGFGNANCAATRMSGGGRNIARFNGVPNFGRLLLNVYVAEAEVVEGEGGRRII